MAKTLQDILRPEFLPDIISRIYTAPPIFIPKHLLVLPTYDIPRHMNDEEMLQSIIRTSILWSEGTIINITTTTRGCGKVFIKITEPE